MLELVTITNYVPFRMLQQHDKERGCEIQCRNNSLVLKHLPKEIFIIFF
jgi:hypothetical protein